MPMETPLFLIAAAVLLPSTQERGELRRQPQELALKSTRPSAAVAQQDNMKCLRQNAKARWMFTIFMFLFVMSTSVERNVGCVASVVQHSGTYLAGSVATRPAIPTGHCPVGVTFSESSFHQGTGHYCSCGLGSQAANPWQVVKGSSWEDIAKGGKKKGKTKRNGIHRNTYFGRVDSALAGQAGSKSQRFEQEQQGQGHQEHPLPPPPWGFPPGVKVVPPFLSWEDQHVCTTAQTTLRIVNLSNTTDLSVHSATSSCFDFYMAEFQDTRVPPNAVFFLNVFFLPRTLGLIDGNLTVYTSLGPIVVPLYGNGLSSPYGLDAKVSLRARIGQKVKHGITLTNPFDWPITVQDLQKKEDFYLSGIHKAESCNCRMSHVKVYVGGKEIAPDADQWAGERGGLEKYSEQLTIEPGKKKEVLEVELGHGDMGRLSASIFLRLSGGCKQEYLLIPIDLTTAWGGVFPTEDEVNFGTLTSLKQTVIRHLELANTGSKPGTLEEIRLTARDENFAQIRFRKGQVLYPGKSTVVSELKYQALNEPSPVARYLAAGKPRGPMGALAYADEWWKVGKIVVHTNHRNSSVMEVAYRARVVLGTVHLEPKSGAVFVAGLKPLSSDQEEHVDVLRIAHQVTLRNTFSCPILVYAGYFSHSCVEAPEFPVATLIPAGGTSNPFLIHVIPDRIPSVPFVVTFSVATNVTEVSLFLHVVSGRLEASLPAAPAPGEAESESTGSSSKSAGDKTRKPRNKGKEPDSAPPPPPATGGKSLSVPPVSRILDFGLVQVGRTVSRSFNISSRCPLDIPVQSISWSSQMLSVRVEQFWLIPANEGEEGGADDTLPTVHWGSGTLANESLQAALPLEYEPNAGEGDNAWAEHKAKGSDTLLFIPGWHAAQVAVVLTATQEEAGDAVVQIRTPYEVMEIKVSYETLSGSVTLTPPVMGFPELFPGKRHELPLYSSSKFNKGITLRSLRSADPRIVPSPQQVQVRPRGQVKIGSITLDPLAGRSRKANGSHACVWEEQLGLPVTADDYEREYLATEVEGTGEGLESSSVEVEGEGRVLGQCDRLEVEWWGEITEEEKAANRARQQAWEQMVTAGQDKIKAEVTVDFEGMLPVSLNVVGSLTLPTVAEYPSGLDFAKVELGDVLRQGVRVINPSNFPVRMQLVVDHASERCETQEAVCRARSRATDGCGSRWQDEVNSILPDALKWWKTKEEYQKDRQQAAADKPSFFLEEDAVSELVIPSQGMAVMGPISFRPGRVCRLEGMAYIRNNLTFLDLIELKGEGGSGCLHFHEADGSPADLLSLNVSAADIPPPPIHEANPPPPARVERTFHAKNTGNMRLDVSSLSLLRGQGTPPPAKGSKGSAGACSSRGFTLQPCAAQGGDEFFSLRPGEYKVVTISYQPDLSSLVSTVTVRADSSVGDMLFPLAGRVPRHLLSAMLASQAVSPVQSAMKTVVLVGLLTLLAYILQCLKNHVVVSPAPWLPALSGAAVSSLSRRISARQNCAVLNSLDLEQVAAAGAAGLGLGLARESIPEGEGNRGQGAGSPVLAVPARIQAGPLGHSRSWIEEDGGGGERANGVGEGDVVPVLRAKGGKEGSGRGEEGRLAKGNGGDSSCGSSSISRNSSSKSSKSNSSTCSASVSPSASSEGEGAEPGAVEKLPVAQVQGIPKASKGGKGKSEAAVAAPSKGLGQSSADKAGGDTGKKVEKAEMRGDEGLTSPPKGVRKAKTNDGVKDKAGDKASAAVQANNGVVSPVKSHTAAGPGRDKAGALSAVLPPSKAPSAGATAPAPVSPGARGIQATAVLEGGVQPGRIASQEPPMAAVAEKAGSKGAADGVKKATNVVKRTADAGKAGPPVKAVEHNASASGNAVPAVESKRDEVPPPVAKAQAEREGSRLGTGEEVDGAEGKEGRDATPLQRPETETEVLSQQTPGVSLLQGKGNKGKAFATGTPGVLRVDLRRVVPQSEEKGEKEENPEAEGHTDAGAGAGEAKGVCSAEEGEASGEEVLGQGKRQGETEREEHSVMEQQLLPTRLGQAPSEAQRGNDWGLRGPLGTLAEDGEGDNSQQHQTPRSFAPAFAQSPIPMGFGSSIQSLDSPYLPTLSSFGNIATDAVVKRSSPVASPWPGQGGAVPPGSTAPAPPPSLLAPGSTGNEGKEVTGALTETASAPAHLYDIWGSRFSPSPFLTHAVAGNTNQGAAAAGHFPTGPIAPGAPAPRSAVGPVPAAAAAPGPFSAFSGGYSLFLNDTPSAAAAAAAAEPFSAPSRSLALGVGAATAGSPGLGGSIPGGGVSLFASLQAPASASASMVDTTLSPPIDILGDSMSLELESSSVGEMWHQSQSPYTQPLSQTHGSSFLDSHGHDEN